MVRLIRRVIVFVYRCGSGSILSLGCPVSLTTSPGRRPKDTFSQAFVHDAILFHDFLAAARLTSERRSARVYAHPCFCMNALATHCPLFRRHARPLPVPRSLRKPSRPSHQPLPRPKAPAPAPPSSRRPCCVGGEGTRQACGRTERSPPRIDEKRLRRWKSSRLLPPPPLRGVPTGGMPGRGGGAGAAAAGRRGGGEEGRSSRPSAPSLPLSTSGRRRVRSGSRALLVLVRGRLG